MRDHPLLDHKLHPSNSHGNLLNQRLRLDDVAVKARVVAAIATVMKAMGRIVWFFALVDDAPTTTKVLVLIRHHVKLTPVLTHRRFAEDASVTVYTGHE
jgi:hypothetical protein